MTVKYSSAPRPRWESLHCSSDPLARFKGAYFQGKEGKKDGREGQRREEGKGW